MKTKTDEQANCFAELCRTMKELLEDTQRVQSAFDYAESIELIDACIYELRALDMKRKHCLKLLKKAKALT